MLYKCLMGRICWNTVCKLDRANNVFFEAMVPDMSPNGLYNLLPHQSPVYEVAVDLWSNIIDAVLVLFC